MSKNELSYMSWDLLANLTRDLTLSEALATVISKPGQVELVEDVACSTCYPPDNVMHLKRHIYTPRHLTVNPMPTVAEKEPGMNLP